MPMSYLSVMLQVLFPLSNKLPNWKYMVIALLRFNMLLFCFPLPQVALFLFQVTGFQRSNWLFIWCLYDYLKLSLKQFKLFLINAKILFLKITITNIVNQCFKKKTIKNLKPKFANCGGPVKAFGGFRALSSACLVSIMLSFALRSSVSNLILHTNVSVKCINCFSFSKPWMKISTQI